MVRISLGTGSVSNDIPLIRERVYILGNDTRLFVLQVSHDVELLIYSSAAEKLGVDYYRRRVSLHGHELTIDYQSMLFLDFSALYVHRDNVKYRVKAVMYGKAEYLGELSRDVFGVYRFDDEVIDTTSINRLYMKCKMLG